MLSSCSHFTKTSKEENYTKITRVLERFTAGALGFGLNPSMYAPVGKRVPLWTQQTSLVNRIVSKIETDHHRKLTALESQPRLQIFLRP